MYSVGILLGVLISIIYPLGIAILFKILKFEEKLWKYFLIAFIMGALFFYIGLIRGIYSLFVPSPALYWVSLIVGAFVDECMKLLVIFLLIRKINPDEENGMYFGLIVGLGLGTGEMLVSVPTIPADIINIQNLFLNSIFWYVLLPQLSDYFIIHIFYFFLAWIQYTSLAGLFGIPLIALFERFLVVLFHSATAIIIGYGFNTDSPTHNIKNITLKPYIIFYFFMVGIHTCLNLFEILFYLQAITILIKEIMIMVISIPCFIGATWLLLRKS